MPTIDYEHADFPPGTMPASGNRLTVTWNELLWAAITVGRPDLYHVFRHGDSSLYEAIFRWSMLRMSLEQRGPAGTRLYRTAAFKGMDPTEKGAVNYFLGLVFCKLFAAKLLNAPWTLHLDLWRDVLNPRLLTGRSRPDMVAQSTLSSDWYAFECKGRSSAPNEAEKQRAKDQAERIISVGGSNCSLHIGSIMYFRGDILQFFWQDPEPPRREQIELPRPENYWQAYYRYFIAAYRSYGSDEHGLTPGRGVRLEGLDLTHEVHPAIAPLLLTNRWQEATQTAREMRRQLHEQGFHPDGLRVTAGVSWQAPREGRTLRR